MSPDLVTHLMMKPHDSRIAAICWSISSRVSWSIAEGRPSSTYTLFKIESAPWGYFSRKWVAALLMAVSAWFPELTMPYIALVNTIGMMGPSGSRLSTQRNIMYFKCASSRCRLLYILVMSYVAAAGSSLNPSVSSWRFCNEFLPFARNSLSLLMSGSTTIRHGVVIEDDFQQALQGRKCLMDELAMSRCM